MDVEKLWATKKKLSRSKMGIELPRFKKKRKFMENQERSNNSIKVRERQFQRKLTSELSQRL